MALAPRVLAIFPTALPSGAPTSTVCPSWCCHCGDRTWAVADFRGEVRFTLAHGCRGLRHGPWAPLLWACGKVKHRGREHLVGQSCSSHCGWRVTERPSVPSGPHLLKSPQPPHSSQAPQVPMEAFGDSLGPSSGTGFTAFPGSAVEQPPSPCC